jgi:hypothetical protein
MVAAMANCEQRIMSTLSALAIAVLVAGCGASQRFQGRVFDNGSVRYRVGALDAGFEPISVGENDLAWHHAQLGTISVNSTCKQYEDVPARALVNQLLMGTTDRVYRVEETITLDGRAAQHLLADVELDGVPITIDVYLIVKDGCVYDLTHVAGRERAEQARPLFERFVRSFSVIATRNAEG